MSEFAKSHPSIHSTKGIGFVLLLAEIGFPQHRIGTLFDEDEMTVSAVIRDHERTDVQ